MARQVLGNGTTRAMRRFKTGTIAAMNNTVGNVTITTANLTRPATARNGVPNVTGGNVSANFETTDVGRYLCILDIAANGDARRYYRRIVEFISSTTVRLNAPWGISPFRAETSLRGANVAGSTNAAGRFIEGVPDVGADFVISWSLEEMSEALDEVEDVDGNGKYFRIRTQGTAPTGNHNYSANVDMLVMLEGFAVHSRDSTFEYNYAGRLQNRFDTFMIFGDIEFGDTTLDTINGYPTNPCRLFDTSTTFATSNAGTLDQGRGVFHQYGGTYEVPNITFLRLYRNGASAANQAADARHDFRQINVARSGNFACRLSGERSVVLDGSSSGGTLTSSLIYFNPIAPGLVQGDSIRSTTQAVYHFPEFAGSVTYPATSIQDINTTSNQFNPNRIIRGDHNNTNVTNNNSTLTLEDWSLDELMRESTPDGTDLYLVENAGTSTHSMNLDKRVNFTFTIVNPDGSTTTKDINGVTRDGRDASPATVDVATTDNSLTRLLRAWEFDATDTIDNFQDDDAVDFTPYTYGFKARRQSYLSSTNTLAGPAGPINLAITLLPDVNLVDTDANIDTYTELETAQKLYDYADLYKFNNRRLPTITSVPFTLSGTEIVMVDEAAARRRITVVEEIAGGGPMTINSSDIIFEVGNGQVFTGSLNGRDQDIDLNTIRIDGNLITSGSLAAPNLETTLPTEADRDIDVKAFTGTFTGGGDLSINVPSGTMYLVLSDTDQHAFTLNKTGSGTLTVVGDTQGYYANADGSLRTNRGITIGNVAGTLNAEPAPGVRNLELVIRNGQVGDTIRVYNYTNGNIVAGITDVSLESHTFTTAGEQRFDNEDINGFGTSITSLLCIFTSETGIPRLYFRSIETATVLENEPEGANLTIVDLSTVTRDTATVGTIPTAYSQGVSIDFFQNLRDGSTANVFGTARYNLPEVFHTYNATLAQSNQLAAALRGLPGHTQSIYRAFNREAGYTQPTVSGGLVGNTEQEYAFPSIGSDGVNWRRHPTNTGIRDYRQEFSGGATIEYLQGWEIRADNATLSRIAVITGNPNPADNELDPGEVDKAARLIEECSVETAAGNSSVKSLPRVLSTSSVVGPVEDAINAARGPEQSGGTRATIQEAVDAAGGSGATPTQVREELDLLFRVPADGRGTDGTPTDETYPQALGISPD